MRKRDTLSDLQNAAKLDIGAYGCSLLAIVAELGIEALTSILQHLLKHGLSGVESTNTAPAEPINRNVQVENTLPTSPSIETGEQITYESTSINKV